MVAWSPAVLAGAAASQQSQQQPVACPDSAPSAVVLGRMQPESLPPEAPAPTAHAPTGQPQAKGERVEPLYQPDGTPCCPVHKKHVKEGQWGLYCSAKDEAAPRGYCALRFVQD